MVKYRKTYMGGTYMKRVLAIVIIAFLSFGLSACSQNIPSQNTTSQTKEKELSPEEAKNKLEKEYSTPYTPKNFLTLIKSNDIEKVKLFLKAGMDSNTKELEDKSWYSKTSLMIAAASGYEELTSLLIENGADVNALDDKGRNVLWPVIDANKPNVIKILVNNGLNIEYKEPKENGTAIFYAVTNNRVDIVKILIENGANIKETIGGGTLLHLAAYKNVNAEIFKTLVEKGLDINVKDNYGMTPLHMAIGFSNEDAVKTLLDLGANISIKDKQGITPLRSAELFKETEIINILKSKKK